MSFAKVSPLNPDELNAEISRAVADLARRWPEIERVYLFGSLARGQAMPGSDADLIVVVSEQSFYFRTASRCTARRAAGLGLTCFHTPDAVARRTFSDAGVAGGD